MGRGVKRREPGSDVPVAKPNLTRLILRTSLLLLLVTVAVDLLPTRASPLPQTEEGGFASGGLGLTLKAFHTRYGTGDRSYLGETVLVDNGRLIVAMAPNGKIATIERTFDQQVDFPEARATGLQLAPLDAVLIQTYATDVNSFVDVLTSGSLATQFPETTKIGTYEYPTWPNAQPGQFIIGYAGYDPAQSQFGVTELLIELGNHP